MCYEFVDWIQLAQDRGPLVCFFEHDNETLDVIKDGKYRDQVNNW
jgi:hypothetical protein